MRPEFLRLHAATPADAENVGRGDALQLNIRSARACNTSVSVGDKVMILEQSRAAGAGIEIDSKVLVGWDSRDALFVES